MPETRIVDWRTIRAEYEQTDVSDTALAQRWGFKSGTTIARKRLAEGWTRDVEAVAANLVTRAVAGTARDPSFCRRRQNDQATTPRRASSVLPPAEVVAPEKKPDLATAHSRGWDLSEADKLATAKDLATIRAEAIAAQLATADRMVTAGNLWLESLVAIASARDHSVESGQQSDFRDAVGRVSSVSDKDTISSLMKSVASLLAEGVRIQREALGMATPLPKNEGPAPAGSSGHRPQDVLVLLDQQTLERMSQAATRLALQRPTIEGQVETTATSA